MNIYASETEVIIIAKDTKDAHIIIEGKLNLQVYKFSQVPKL